MELSNLIISEDLPIRDALKRLDETAKKILLITEDDKLKAVLTDGDIRRWILKNGDLGASVKSIMNTDPIYVRYENRHEVRNIMKKYLVDAIPVVDDYGKPLSIIFWNDVIEKESVNHRQINIPVVIMAGGKGTRLYPYTKILPKPLIPIGETPIVERIIDRFKESGCRDFYLTVNYKKNMIKSYFNDLEKDYNIYYAEEDKPLGTAGSLYLLKNKINETFFLSNCDILIEADYYDILKHHKDSGNKITVVTSLRNYIIPYGVITLNKDGTINNTIEKPEYNFLVNTGMYIIEPEVLKEIPDNVFCDLPSIVTTHINCGERVGVYPISERSWMDMGRISDMNEMIERLDTR